MKNNTLIGCLAVWTAFSSVASAQISTFPTPPPLPPRLEPATNGPSSTIPSPPALAPGSEPAPNGPSSALPITPPMVPGPGEVLLPDTNSAAGNPTGGTPLPGTASSLLSPSKVPATDTVPISASTLNSMAALDDKVALEAGDHISFRVIEDRDDAVPRVVTDTGEVDFPYIGRVKVGGQTCRQVADQLKKLLEVDYYKRATVIVGLDVIVGHQTAAAPQQVIWLVGQVHQVGPQELPKDRTLTVSQVILRAGGFADFADERRVRLVHRAAAPASPGKTTAESLEAGNASDGQKVDVKSILDGQPTPDPVVQPNDLIIVPKRLINL